MARIRLNDWYDEEKTCIKAEIRSLAHHGTVSKGYLSKAQLRRFEEDGYAFVNLPKEYMV